MLREPLHPFAEPQFPYTKTFLSMWPFHAGTALCMVGFQYTESKFSVMPNCNSMNTQQFPAGPLAEGQ